MTSHIGRLYALAGTLLCFFLAWALISAHPWRTASSDPRLLALAQREQRLRADAAVVRRVVARRQLAYREALAARRRQIAARLAVARAATAAPSASSLPVRVVTLPPLTITRTS
jgi:hypothetical protein